MRLAIFIKGTHFHTGFGGLETQNKVLCEGLAKRGHEVIVFSPQRELILEHAVESSVSYRFISCVYKLLACGKDSWITQSIEDFKKLHAEQPFDLVISQSSAGLGIIKCKQALSVKVISISHGTIIGEFKTRLQSIASILDVLKLIPDSLFVLKVFFGRQRDFIHGSDKIIAVSNAVKEALVSETFVEEKKIVVINNGIVPPVFSESFLKQDSPLVNFIYLGRVIRSKGVFNLIKVFSDPAFSKARLHIIGDGKDRVMLADFVKKHGFSGRVTFYGNIPHTEAMAKLQMGDIFVLPSLRFEGFPMVLVEAMFAGLPIIASDIGGISDAVQNNVTGFLISPKDVESLRAKMLELFSTPELCKVLGTAGKKVALERFSLNAMLTKYEYIFKEVLQ